MIALHKVLRNTEALADNPQVMDIRPAIVGQGHEAFPRSVRVHDWRSENRIQWVVVRW